MLQVRGLIAQSCVDRSMMVILPAATIGVATLALMHIEVRARSSGGREI
jgi:hypothetical protein